MDSLPRLWLNIDEFLDIFKAELEPYLFKTVNDKLDIFKNSCDLMNQIYDLLPEDKFKDIARKIDDIIFGIKYKGEPHIDGIRSEVPPLKIDFDTIWTPPERITLTGIQLELTGWKPHDKYSLLIRRNDKSRFLINQVPFKESGEHKILPIAYPFGFSKKTVKLDPDDDVIFRIHNNSGNSRQLYWDIEYLTLGNLPPSGSTILFLDVSGSMWDILERMSELMVVFLQNLYGTDPVTVCFVSGIGMKYTRGSYYFVRKDFANKYKAMEYLSVFSNIPHQGGGDYDIVTVQSAMDYKINNFDNYIFCTDQTLESNPNTQFMSKLQKFFSQDQYVFSLPVSDGDRVYWNLEYQNLKLFKPI